MAIASATRSRMFARAGGGPGGWDRRLFHLLTLAGAATVVAGCYTTWATFYAGLIARNGVSGHGKYFIGLAAAAVVAGLLSSMRGVWGGLRWATPFAAAVIAAVALRDLRNLDALVHDPAAGFYLPGRGPGLTIVIIGAIVLGLVPIARPLRRGGSARLPTTLVAVLITLGVAMLVPGFYGEYYLHVAHGHAHGHTDALNTAHLLTAGGVLLAAAAAHIVILSRLASRCTPPPGRVGHGRGRS